MKNLEDKIYFSVTQSSFKNTEECLSDTTNTLNKCKIIDFDIRIVYDKEDKYKEDILYLLSLYYKNFLDLDPELFNNYISLNEYKGIFTNSLVEVLLFPIFHFAKNPKEFLIHLKDHINFIKNRFKYYFSNKKSINKLHQFCNIEDLESKCKNIYKFLNNISNKKMIKIIKTINDKTVNYSDSYISELLNIFNNIEEYINLSVDVITTGNVKYEKGKDYTNLIGKIPNKNTIKVLNSENSSFSIDLYFKSNYNIEDNQILQYIFGSSNIINGEYDIILDSVLFENKEPYIHVTISTNNENIMSYIKNYYNSHLDNLLMMLSNDIMKTTNGIFIEIYYNLYKRLGVINNNYNYRQYLSQYKYGDIKEILDNIFNNLNDLVYVEVISNKEDFDKFINNNKELLKDFKIDRG